MVLQYSALALGLLFGILSLTSTRSHILFRVLCILSVFASVGMCCVAIRASDTFAKVQSAYNSDPTAEFTAGARKAREVAAEQVPAILVGTAALALLWLLQRPVSGRQSSEPDSAANGSQPIRSETNSSSSAAGSRR